ncbi:MAG: S24/S26 family peptidase [Coriobacteriales bacterium]|jgi:hypothetical protein|nr:S24/S26 family peptidase [Coriobacteriales bacterium]
MSAKTLALKARLQSSGEISMRLKGGCMEPLLRTGDEAKIIPAMEVKRGRIYLIELAHNDIVLHRAIAVHRDEVITKGDYTGIYESNPTASIIGVLFAIKPRGSDFWHEFDGKRSSYMISAVLSNLLVRDKRLGKESLCHRMVRLASKKILAAYSHQIRKRWKMI